MKKLITMLALVLTLAATTFANAGVYFSTYTPYHAPVHPVAYGYYPHHIIERTWVPGRGWVVYGPNQRVLAWNRYHRCWM